METMTPLLCRAFMRRPVAVLSTLGLLAGLAACGGDDGSSDEASDDQSRAGGSAALTWPMTGEPVDGELPAYPVMVVKIDNTEASEPQLGLGHADLVTEELVEGGSTRLAVFFHSSLPDLTGPVRSMRASDIGIVKPADAVLIASGGAGPTRARIDGANIDNYLEGEAGFERADDRSAPYNLMMALPELAETLDDAEAPPPYLPFGDNPMDGGKPAESFDVAFSGGHTTSWQYENDGYTRPGSFADPDDDFVADNVLVLRVKIGDAGYKDPAGNPVPETIYEGTGDAMLFHGGKVVEGKWSKDELKSPLSLETGSGDELSVPPGNTWIELVPVDDGSVSIKK